MPPWTEGRELSFGLMGFREGPSPFDDHLHLSDGLLHVVSAAERSVLTKGTYLSSLASPGSWRDRTLTVTFKER